MASGKGQGEDYDLDGLEIVRCSFDLDLLLQTAAGILISPSSATGYRDCIVHMTKNKSSYGTYCKLYKTLSSQAGSPIVVMTVVEKNRAPENFHCDPNRYGMNLMMFAAIC